MEYTAASLIERIKVRLRDPEFSDEDLLVFLNDEQNEVLGESTWQFMERIFEEDIVVEGGEMVLPEDYQVTLRIVAESERAKNAVLAFVPFRDYFSGIGLRPFTYTRYENKIIFTLPDLATDSGPVAWKIRHYYLARPEDMMPESVPYIPQEFKEILVLGAMARAEETRDNYDFGAVQGNKRLTLIENMKLRYGPSQDQINVGRLPYHA